MDESSARAILALPQDQSSWEYICEHESAFFWDEYGDECEQWQNLVATPYGLPAVSQEHDDDIEEEDGHPFFLVYRDTRLAMPFVDEAHEDHTIAILTLAQLVRADCELRLCLDSVPSKTLAFLALAPAQWEQLAQEFGTEVVAARFMPLPAGYEEFCTRADDNASTYDDFAE